jgi:uncharacterized BrkB/YihY/UPF0761 family membrane protein
MDFMTWLWLSNIVILVGVKLKRDRAPDGTQ